MFLAMTTENKGIINLIVQELVFFSMRRQYRDDLIACSRAGVSNMKGYKKSNQDRCTAFSYLEVIYLIKKIKLDV